MNITLKKLGQSRTQATVILNDAKVNPLREEALKELGVQVEIQGFRPGKAPIEKVRERIPEQQVHEEVVRKLMPEVMKEAIERHDLKPIIRPNVELSSLTPFTLLVTVVERPQVKVDSKKVMKIWKVWKVEKSGGSERDEESKVLELISEHTKVELAPELVDDEVRDVLQQHIQRLKQHGMELDQWLTEAGKRIEDLIKEIRPDAEKRLKVRFGIGQLIDDWKIEVSDEDVNMAVKELLKPLKDEERSKLSELYKPGTHPYEQFRFQKKVEKVMEDIRSTS
jgi:FKBP-type peptidyl-prolyl cis-trans isomerase (trigger factor)